MRDVNEITIIGNLGDHPKIKAMADGKAIANLSVATNERWSNSDGQTRERTEWHKVAAFGWPAEFARDNLAKGDRVLVQGKIQTRSWEDNGQTRYMTEVAARCLEKIERPQKKEEIDDGYRKDMF